MTHLLRLLLTLLALAAWTLVAGLWAPEGALW